MPQPNMKKEYRAELSLLRKNRRHALRDWKAFSKATVSTLRKITREINRVSRRYGKTFARFDKRIAIVEGRLS